MVLKKIEKGLLLISDPSIIGDSTFNRSVILLTEHNGSGSVGFVLNKPTPHTLHELIDDIHADFVVYDGGPVEQDNLYFIHTLPQLITNSIEIADGIYWGGDFELTKNLINEGQILDSGSKQAQNQTFTKKLKKFLETKNNSFRWRLSSLV
jgi:putative transcriptional regulator